MTNLLNNPVFNALSSGDAHLGFGNEKAKSYFEEVSPFAGFEDGYKNGFDDLYDLFPAGHSFLYATQHPISIPLNWRLVQHVEGVQMIHNKKSVVNLSPVTLVPLNASHVEEMMQLTELTKPGPFEKRTIEFGNYYGIFDGNKLVSMAGQRMHLVGYTEISAVCTHPDYLGKGYAYALVRQLVNVIYDLRQIPFLHVRGDNFRAIGLYERMGFNIRSPMHFYFMKKKNTKK